MAISPMEEVMQKSEFFTHLNRIGAVCAMFRHPDRIEKAKECSIRSDIFLDDPESEPDPNHPVLSAILVLASGQFTGEAVAEMEAAWEYFQGKSDSTNPPWRQFEAPR